MTIKDKLSGFFKLSDKNKENKIIDREFKFGEMTNKDVVNLNIDEFKNKCEKETEKLIENISSLSKEQRGERLAYISEFFNKVKEVPRIIRFSTDLSTKYQILYKCIKKYQNELLKNYE